MERAVFGSAMPLEGERKKFSKIFQISMNNNNLQRRSMKDTLKPLHIAAATKDLIVHYQTTYVLIDKD